METLTSTSSLVASIDRGAVETGQSRTTVNVRVHHHSEVDPALNHAVSEVRAAAIRQQTGIMITRTGAGRYTVQTHPAVPFGTTRLQHQ